MHSRYLTAEHMIWTHRMCEWTRKYETKLVKTMGHTKLVLIIKCDSLHYEMWDRDSVNSTYIQ